MSPPTVPSPTPGRAKRRWVLGWLTLPILALITVVALLAYQLAGPAHTAREQGVAVLRQQTALLPPYAGGEAAETIVYDQPFRDPTIQIAYTLPGQCTDLQTYYAARTLEQGWSMAGPVQIIQDPADPQNAGHDVLHSDFHKGVQGYVLELVIECYRDQTYSPGYIFSMTAN